MDEFRVISAVPWITTEVDSKVPLNDLASLLSKNCESQLILVDYTVKDLVPLGENFGSHVMRVIAKIRRKEDSIIEDQYFVAKMTMSTSCLINWTRLFEKELFMYKIIVPFYRDMEMRYKVQNDNNISRLFPTLYGYRMSLISNTKTADQDAVILLQDLKAEGFQTMDRKKGLDLEHAEEALEALAEFHAFGIVAKLKYPSEFKELQAESQKPGFGCDGMEEICAKVLEIIKKDNRFKRFYKKFEKIVSLHSRNLKQELMRHDLWSSIVHYDFWTNNIMFHHDIAGNVDGVKFIDFQTYTYANITADLPYFLCTSLREEITTINFNQLIDTYYDAFINILKVFEVDPKMFSRNEFNDRLRKDAALEFLHCVFSLYFFTAEHDHYEDEQQKDVLSSIMNSRINDSFLNQLVKLFEVYEREEWF